MRFRPPDARNQKRGGAEETEARTPRRGFEQKEPQLPLDVAPRLIKPKEFLHFQALIYRESGIWLSEAKTELLTGRLSKRLRTLGLKTFSDYYTRVRQDDEER